MRTRTLWLTDQRGVALPMAMLALLILSALVVGFSVLSATEPTIASNQLSTATFLANQRLEQIRNATWRAAQPAPAVPAVVAVDKLGVSASNAAPVGDGGVTTFPDEVPLGAPYDGYTRTVRITSCDAGPGCGGIVHADLRQVTVTVSYRPMTGIGVAPAATTKSAVVTMYVAKR